MADVHLSRITIYPIKSLDGIDVDEVQILPNGALKNDRRFALVDADGRFVNGKRTAAVHQVRAEYDLSAMTVHLSRKPTNNAARFSLVDDAAAIGRWLSDALGIACNLTENADGGFPDDADAPGPTLISTATLREVAGWFPGLTLNEVRRRFRANLEIDGVEPFWEDRLVPANDQLVEFTIGIMQFVGVNPCQRCVVPGRATETGEPTAGFQKTFALEREQSLPAWSPRERFDHFYRLAVNTHSVAGQPPGSIFVRAPVVLVSRETLP
jgi:uncharacterized protein YcbX